MTPARYSLVFVGLSLSSSWGNGHATTYRALLRALAERGHEVVFLEREQPWYATNRDLHDPEFCTLDYYDGVGDLVRRHASTIADADMVVIGSYVPDGVAVAEAVLERARGLVCFYDIDTPVTLAALERGACAYLTPELIPAFAVYFSFAGGAVLDELESRWSACRAEALYCMVDPARYAPTDAPPRWDLGYLGTYSADRQPALERLLFEPARRLPEKRFVVAGAQYPDDVDWPANVEHMEHVPPEGHAEFYGLSRYTLNLTRADMIRTGWSPSVRLFEAAACATPVITDPWPGLDAFFRPGETIVVARSADDVVVALQERPERARAMARRAREETLQRHTGSHRAAQLERTLQNADRDALQRAV